MFNTNDVKSYEICDPESYESIMDDLDKIIEVEDERGAIETYVRIAKGHCAPYELFIVLYATPMCEDRFLSVVMCVNEKAVDGGNGYDEISEIIQRFVKESENVRMN